MSSIVCRPTRCSDCQKEVEVRSVSHKDGYVVIVADCKGCGNDYTVQVKGEVK